MAGHDQSVAGCRSARRGCAQLTRDVSASASAAGNGDEACALVVSAGIRLVDLERAVRFYAEVLGLPVVDRWEDRGAVWVMAAEQTRIGLWLPQVGRAGGRGGVHVHYALHINENDFDAAVERLRRRGYEPHQTTFSGRSLYVDDPDGNVVELWTWDVANHLRGGL